MDVGGRRLRIPLPNHGVIGIDPGPQESAVVLLMPNGEVRDPTMQPNSLIAESLPRWGDWSHHLIVETLTPLDERIGQESLDTHGWAWVFAALFPGPSHKLSRYQVEAALAVQNDAGITAACLELLGHENRRVAVGTKKKPGPLYGMKKHLWQALGVALAWVVLNKGDKR